MGVGVVRGSCPSALASNLSGFSGLIEDPVGRDHLSHCSWSFLSGRERGLVDDES